MAKLCGLPGKLGIAGRDVADYVAAGRLREVVDYCLCDVVQTAGVFLRVQLLRGALAREDYVAAAKNLVSCIKSDPRLEPVASGLNEARFLLEEQKPE